MPTPNLSLEPLAASQAQKHVTVNEALARIDAVTQLAILDRDLAAPPPTPSDGDRYLIATAATGAWAGHDGKIAAWDEAAQIWLFLTPREGWRLWVADEARYLIRTGAAWSEIGGISLNPVQDGLLGVNTIADATNRLAVKSDAVLISHDDVTPGSGDIRLTINRAANTNAASLIFQTAYNGNAEIGLTDADNFALRISPDGVTFTDALRISLTDGSVSLPNGATFEGGATAQQIATAATSAHNARIEAQQGNLARSRSMVMEAETLVGPNTVIASAEDDNMLVVDGAYQTTLAKGQIFSGSFPAGTLIETSRGHSGASASPGGPMPLGLEAMSARHFVFFILRSLRETGFIKVAASGFPARVELRDSTGTVVEDGPYDIPAYGLLTLTAPRTGEEYQVIADQDVFLSSRTDDCDHRLISPPTCELIGHARLARISALHPNTQVSWWLQDGQSGSFTVSPGTSASFTAETGLAISGGFNPSGFAILRASAPISVFAATDGAGKDATPFVALEMLGQRVPIPFESEGGHPARTSSIAIASPFEGNAKIFDASGAFVADIPLQRGSTSPATSVVEQAFPAAALFVPAAGLSIGPGGYIEADVPIYVVQNAHGPLNPFQLDSDEIFLPAITPEDIRAELRRDGAGLLRRRMIDGAGLQSWVVT